MERIYDIAGVRLRVIVPEGSLCPGEDILESFAVTGGFDHTVEFCLVDQLSAPEGEPVYRDAGKQVFRFGKRQLRYDGAVAQSLEGAYLRIDREGSRSFVQLKRSAIPCGVTNKLIMDAMEAEHLICHSGGFLLHASVIEVEGRAILFTAPSGTGKSTQAALWQKYAGARPVNGDRAAVRGGTVWGIPFCGSSGQARRSVLPIAAIVYLTQAPQTVLRRLTGAEAFRKLWEGCSINVWDAEDMESCTDAVAGTLAAVPVYHLACTPDETAVRVLQKEVES